MYFLRQRFNSGADTGFSFRGGGGAKDYMRERTLRTRNPKSLSAGIQGPLKGPGSALGVFDAL